MMRYLIAFNVLALYVIYIAGKLHPHPLSPIEGAFDYVGLAVAGVNTLIACVAVLRWKELDAW